MHHVSMFFLGKAIFHFLPREKRSCFLEKIPSLQIIQEGPCAGASPSGKTIFSEGLKEISYFCVFFKKDHLSFSTQRVRSYFPDNTRKIIFQRYFLGKTIFSGRPEKENMVFRAVIKEHNPNFPRIPDHP